MVTLFLLRKAFVFLMSSDLAKTSPFQSRLTRAKLCKLVKAVAPSLYWTKALHIIKTFVGVVHGGALNYKRVWYWNIDFVVRPISVIRLQNNVYRNDPSQYVFRSKLKGRKELIRLFWWFDLGTVGIITMPGMTTRILTHLMRIITMACMTMRVTTHLMTYMTS